MLRYQPFCSFSCGGLYAGLYDERVRQSRSTLEASVRPSWWSARMHDVCPSVRGRYACPSVHELARADHVCPSVRGRYSCLPARGPYDGLYAGSVRRVGARPSSRGRSTGSVRRGPYADFRRLVRRSWGGRRRSVRRGLYAEVRTRVRTQTFRGPFAVRGKVDGVCTQVRTQNS